MSTVTYYVLRNSAGQYIDDEYNHTGVPQLAASWSSLLGAKHHVHKNPGFRVVKVTRTIKPRKLHDRKWAMRQLLRDKKISNNEWIMPGAHCKLTVNGIRYFSTETPHGGPESLSLQTGYFLVP